MNTDYDDDAIKLKKCSTRGVHGGKCSATCNFGSRARTRECCSASGCRGQDAEVTLCGHNAACPGTVKL